ncbi:MULTISPECIES: aminoglycoside phosphotransferase family protein [Bacillus]|uniref:aminoglycoside phosphotransferase family protein n=1 Tax=Bacillus TaxID=1386 RepID=UPI0002DFB721|nr:MULTISPECIES: aminoglycoside phosphotransferase family protein [Bacillus]
MSSSYSEESHEFHRRLLKSTRDSGTGLRKALKVRDNVYFVTTNHKKYVVKGFSSRKKYDAQRKLTKLLKRHGFNRTYDFIDQFAPFSYDGEIYAWIEYIKPQKDKFTFESLTCRKEGLKILKDFHNATSNFYDEISIKHFDQLEKWKERLKDFKRNKHIINKYVSSDYLQSWINWGEFSLKGLEKYEKLLYKEKNCIVHGDVAHHNFFYRNDGVLYLIDFDLISKAPPLLDYLQYCNRIMPDIRDSNELWSYKQLQKYKENTAFLYALTFPTDIFREWNRIVREDLFFDQGYLHSVWKLTVEEAKQRMKIYKDIVKLIK